MSAPSKKRAAPPGGSRGGPGAKETAEKLAKNEWIPVDGLWDAAPLEGRGHRDGPHYGRKYRVIVPRADFGEFLFLGGQARFTQVEGGDARIFDLPAQIDRGVSFEFDIHPEALGGTMICVQGLKVRRMPTHAGLDAGRKPSEAGSPAPPSTATALRT